MNRLSTRLLVSHGAVALIGGLTAYVLVRLLTPQLYDHSVRMMMGGTMGDGMRGDMGLRGAAIAATNGALLIGVLVGIAVAVIAGIWSAGRVLRPLDEIGAATRRLAKGRYDERLELPREEELAAVAADVNALAERLADTESRRTRLLGEVAHEMRTPLTVLDGYVEGMIDGVFPPSQETLAELGTELRRLRRLAEDLGALSRAEERGFDLRAQAMDLGAVAARAAQRLRPQLVDAGVGLEITVGETPLRVRGDADRLAQVVTNLVGNALAASSAGGVIRVECAREAKDVVVRVSDTGVGLAPSDLERVFERFYRVRSDARDEHRTGTGIGLTIARAIAQAHDGDLTAASHGVGRGSTFTLRVPARH